MPLRNYGVLRCAIVDHRVASRESPHFELHAVAGEERFRVAINVMSAREPSVLQYLIDAAFRHPVLEVVGALAPGWTVLERTSGGAALDFIRADLFDRGRLALLPYDVPGPDNDLNEKLEVFVRRAIAEAAVAFAFGERWPTTPSEPDPVFGFSPGQGVHDIHMNQSNVAGFVSDDGVWQDGALLLHFPAAPEQWVAVFLKFQSQGWHTDDVTGHAG